MFMFQRLYHVLYHHVANVSWLVIFGLITIHYGVFHTLFTLIGDSNIPTNITDFTYFYVVTGATVGYGDISPSTELGKWATNVFIITGIVILGTFLSKIGITVSTVVKRRLLGMKSYANRKGHIVLFGYRPDDSKEIIAEINRTHPHQIVLVDDQIEQTPDSAIDFVKVNRLSTKDAFERSGVVNAAGVVIQCANDDQTLAVCTALNGLVSGRNVVAYFDNEEMAEIVKGNSPTIECVVPKRAELIARSIVHSGSMALFDTVLSSKHPQTQFASRVKTTKDLNVEYVSDILMKDHRALLVGVRTLDGRVSVNPDRGDKVYTDTVLYYISEEPLGDTILL